MVAQNAIFSFRPVNAYTEIQEAINVILPAYVIDQTHHPEIEITWNRAARPVERQAYFAEVDALLAKHRGLTMLFHIPREAKFAAEHRVQMSRWLKNNEEPLRT